MCYVCFEVLSKEGLISGRNRSWEPYAAVHYDLASSLVNEEEPMAAVTGLVTGAARLLHETVDGLMGVVVAPVTGYHHDGAPGALKETSKAIINAMVAPLKGTMHLLKNVGAGLDQTVEKCEPPSRREPCNLTYGTVTTGEDSRGATSMSGAVAAGSSSHSGGSSSEGFRASGEVSHGRMFASASQATGYGPMSLHRYSTEGQAMATNGRGGVRSGSATPPDASDGHLGGSIGQLAHHDSQAVKGSQQALDGSQVHGSSQQAVNGSQARGGGRAGYMSGSGYGSTPSGGHTHASAPNGECMLEGAQPRPVERRADVKTIPHVGTGLLVGSKAFLKGVRDGVTSLPCKTITGYKQDGVGGAAKGLAMGTLGMITKPVGGVFYFVASVGEGLLNTPWALKDAALGKQDPLKSLRLQERWRAAVEAQQPDIRQAVVCRFREIGRAKAASSKRTKTMRCLSAVCAVPQSP
eukprot:jgi/Mesvir1/18188/Mv25048-RA.2